MSQARQVWVTVWRGEASARVAAPWGATLRAALLENGHTPYRGRFQSLNCKGMGVCGSCLVQIREDGEWGERRSCQIRCFQDLETKLE